MAFTHANAKEMAAKAHETRKANILAREQARAIASLPVPVAVLADGYLTERLMRVRKQLDRIDEMMIEEVDPGKLDRLASAQMRLAEQERILAGRPLPGSLKPASVRSRRNSAPLSPIDPPAQEPG